MTVLGGGPAAPVLSLVIPVFDEAAVIERTVDEIREQVRRTGLPFEVICVDDGSRDRTAEILDRLRSADPRVVVVTLARRFGKEAALAAGMHAAAGAVLIFVDADLQHPPELIPRMVALWREGYDVVNAVKQDRSADPWPQRVAARIFNWLMGEVAGASFRGASDFKLLDRQVVDALCEFPEHYRFFRGLVTWVGFRVAEVPFRVVERAAGASKWSGSALLTYSLRNLVAFSAFPLRVVAAVGFSALLLAAGLALWTLYRYLSGTSLSGFTTVILLQLILGGLLLTSLGVVAVYLAAIYEESKRRPIFVVRSPRPAAAAPAPAAGESPAGDAAPE